MFTWIAKAKTKVAIYQCDFMAYSSEKNVWIVDEALIPGTQLGYDWSTFTFAMNLTFSTLMPITIPNPIMCSIKIHNTLKIAIANAPKTHRISNTGTFLKDLCNSKFSLK